MKTLLRAAALLVLGLSLASGPGAEPVRRYVCPPCGLPCDSAVYDKPGTCPRCGMALVDQETVAHARPTKKVAILIFTGVQIIDYTGPFEVFGAAGFDVYTVGETKEPVTTAMGMTVVPKYSFADAPPPDVLVVPGGGVTAVRHSAPTLQWIRDEAARAQTTMSVCNGAFILASAGLLDGLTATTTSGRIDELKAAYPGIKVVYDQRFVDNGRVVTAAGLTSGIDAALHVVAKMIGKGRAQQVALGEEYDWRPASPFARAALADTLIPDVDTTGIGAWEVVSTAGDRDRWEIVAHGTSELEAHAIMDHLDRALAASGKWTSAQVPATGSSSLSRSWKFSGRDGRAWTGTLTLQAAPGTSHEYTARLAIARVG